MASVPQSNDSRFDAAERDVERGEPWRYREADAPSPLTIEVTGWSTGHTRFGDAEFLSGVDRDGRSWSVLVAGVVLRKRLVEGLVEEWSDEEDAYVVVETLGKAQPGEVLSIKYVGDGATSAGNSYPKFTVSRKPAASPAAARKPESDDVPF